MTSWCCGLFSPEQIAPWRFILLPNPGLAVVYRPRSENQGILINRSDYRSVRPKTRQKSRDCLHEIILDMKITARACLVQHGRQEDMQQLQNRAAPRRRETDTPSFRPCSLSHPQTSGRLICPLKPSERRDESAGKANSVFCFFLNLRVQQHRVFLQYSVRFMDYRQTQRQSHLLLGAKTSATSPRDFLKLRKRA